VNSCNYGNPNALTIPSADPEAGLQKNLMSGGTLDEINVAFYIVCVSSDPYFLLLARSRGRRR
jgi:hypothetical protein